MSEVAIFTYGLVVFAIVSAACWLIVWGIYQERRDRQQMEGEASPESTTSPSARTLASGTTVGAPPGAGRR